MLLQWSEPVSRHVLPAHTQPSVVFGPGFEPVRQRLATTHVRRQAVQIKLRQLVVVGFQIQSPRACLPT